MTLNQLLDGIEVVAIQGDAPADIRGLQYDSRKIEPGQVFVAIQGEVVDGNRFVGSALERGAAGVISERTRPAECVAAVWVQVTEARKALATAAANWYGRPAERLDLVGITGTNGKTTTAFLTDSLLRQSGQRTGLIGTIEYHVADRVVPSPHTTPESMDLQHLFA
jgi:UDP-N-acetylmuramoyl-L-alanyl-D-glutamate--2,6-diaminopimelate ligase